MITRGNGDLEKIDHPSQFLWCPYHKQYKHSEVCKKLCPRSRARQCEAFKKWRDYVGESGKEVVINEGRNRQIKRKIIRVKRPKGGIK